MPKSNFIVRGGLDMSSFYKNMKQSQKQITGFQKSISTSMKLVGASITGIAFGSFIKNSLDAASSLESAMTGLTSIVEGQGRDINRAKSYINDYVKDGLVPLTDAVTAYKNLVARGYNDDQIESTMNRLKDAASSGRQSSYSLGEAVKSATEGLKNENSILVDNAGVTKNVAKMWEDYAKTVGKTSNNLTQQEKIQAEVNGIMQETQWQVGDAAKYTQTYSGRVAALNKTFTDIKVNAGTAFMPIANVVLPILQSLANNLSSVTSSISAFSQALFGKAIVATTSNITDTEEAVTSVGDAAEKAGKKADKAVAPFDELFKIGSSTSGISSISTNPTTSNSTKVTSEEVVNTNNMTEAAERLKTALEPTTKALGNLWNAVKPLGDKVGEGLVFFVDDLKNIGEKALSDWIPGGINALAGAIDSIEASDVTLVAVALAGLATTVLVYQGMTTAASTINGVKKSLVTMVTDLGKHPIALIASGIAGLAIAVLALDEAKFDSSDIGEYIKKVEDLVKKSENFNKETDQMLKDHDDRQDDIEAEYGAIEILAGKYFDLADKQSLSNTEQELLKSYSQELIKKIPELSGLIDLQTGAYKGTRDEIIELIDKTKEYYLVQAAQDSLIEIAEKQYEAQRNLKDLSEERKVAVDKLKVAEDELNTAVQESSTYGEASAETAKKVFLAHQEYDRTINELKRSIKNIDGQIVTTTDTQKKLNSEWDYAVDYIQTYSSTAKTDMEAVKTAVSTALDSVKTTVNNFKLPSIRIGVEYEIGSIPTINTKGGNTFQQYADGGLPPTGQVFIANEAGPELVGRIGNQSAVANSDQIVDALASGIFAPVFNAVSSAMSKHSSSSDIYIDSEFFARATNSGTSRNNRRQNTTLQPV